MKHLIIPVVLLFFGMSQAMASDIDKEKRWAEQIVDALLDGDAHWLKSGNHSFLSIYTTTEDTAKGAVILMHGTGVHPDWPQVIQPLRVSLIESGWNTLSIQLPVLANEAEYPEYAALYNEVPTRIKAAIDFLRAENIKRIVLLGHSQGSAMAAYALSESLQGIDGFVAISMPNFKGDPRMETLGTIKGIKVPILDIFGQSDHEEIIKAAPLRKQAVLSSGNANYQQQQIEGDHFFEGKEKLLHETVSQWLNRL